MMAQTDLYELLGVAKDANQDDIKSAYRRLARQYHPDVNPNNPEAEEKFKEIGQAYAVLSDPQKRSQYDNFGTVGDMPQEGFFANDLSDIFEMFLGGMGGAQQGRRRAYGRDGGDIQVGVQLTLADVITGATREVKVRRLVKCHDCNGLGTEGGVAPETCLQCAGEGVVTRVQNSILGQIRTQTTCPNCHGSGKVIKTPCPTCRGKQQVPEETTVSIGVPPGVESGMQVHMGGKGHEGVGAGRNGDLLAVIQIPDDEQYEREGQHLHATLQLTYAQAAIGDEVEIDGVDAKYSLDVPAGTQPNETLTIKGAGLPPLHGGRRGDIYIHTTVKVPEKLNETQKDLILRLAEASGEDLPKGPKSGGILGGLFKKKK